MFKCPIKLPYPKLDVGIQKFRMSCLITIENNFIELKSDPVVEVNVKLCGSSKLNIVRNTIRKRMHRYLIKVNFSSPILYDSYHFMDHQMAEFYNDDHIHYWCSWLSICPVANMKNLVITFRREIVLVAIFEFQIILHLPLAIFIQWLSYVHDC